MARHRTIDRLRTSRTAGPTSESMDTTTEDAESEALHDGPTPSRSSRLTDRDRLKVAAVAVVAGLVVGLIAAALVLTRPVVYQSQALLSIDQSRAIATSGDDGIVQKLFRLRYKYTGLVQTDVFRDPVVAATGLPRNKVAGSLYATADVNSLLVAVGARSGSKGDVQRIAQAGAEELVSYVRSEQSASDIPPEARITFSIVTPASRAAKISPTRHRAGLVGGGAFLVAAALAGGAAYLWRRGS